MSLVVPFFWTAPVSLFDAALLSSLGFLGGLGHYLIARALTYAPANVLAPFMYWQMVGAVAFGHVASGVLSDALTWAGTAIIMFAGLWIAWRETRDRARQGPSGASPS